jgi:hypothetical protein
VDGGRWTVDGGWWTVDGEHSGGIELSFTILKPIHILLNGVLGHPARLGPLMRVDGQGTQSAGYE